MLRVRNACRRYYTHLELRKNYLEYFEKKGHQIVPSSSVMPSENDGSLLFTNAGMNQFKSKILSSPKSEKIANIQKCIRAGGKHNDLDDVGKDFHHQTFFEMMGNWSFNNAFSKKEACELALTYLVENLKIDPSRLYFSHFSGSPEIAVDSECREIWKNLGVRDSHILGFKDENFWEMGQSGPCGVCTEIHYDRIGGGRDASKMVNSDDSVVEIWNIVFMSKLRTPNGEIKDLGKHHIDTGMGFERLLSIIQNKNSNFDTDLFSPIISEISKITGKKYEERLPSEKDVAFRTIADHIRGVTMAISDGVHPDATGAGFVVRKMLRRMYLQSSRILEMDRFAVSTLVDVVQKSLGPIYPEILNPNVAKIIDSEEEQFWRVVDKAKTQFFNMAKLSSTVISGKDAFNLFETYGMPLEITVEMARSVGKMVDLKEFEEARKEAQRISASSSKFHTIPITAYDFPEHSDDVKYQIENNVCTRILGVFQDNKLVETEAFGKCAIVLEKCQFYGEQGGQAADTGLLKIDGIPVFLVENARKSMDRKITIIYGETLGEKTRISRNLEVEQCVDVDRRIGLMRAHSATHLLNWALRKWRLGDEQRGSSVEDEYLRFDYSTTDHKIIDRFEACKNVERSIIDVIHQNLSSNIRFSTAENVELSDFKKDRVADSEVRIVSFDDGIAEECCSGTHVPNTSQILDFAIMSDKASAKGVRRMTAVCGQKARSCRQYTKKLIEDGIDGDVDWKRIPLLQQKQVKEIVSRNRKRSRSC